MRRSALCLAVLLPVSAALAQQPPAGAGAPSQLEEVGLSPPTVLSEGHQLSAEEITVRALLGQPVHAGIESDAATIGIISDLVIGPLGAITSAIVSLRGVSGVPDKPVAVDFNDLQRLPAQDGETRWVLETTLEALIAAPEFIWPDQAQPAVPQFGAAPDPAGENAFVDPPPAAAELPGMGVYGRNDQPIGTVGAVVESEPGVPDAIIVDVGGFLGLGTTPVAVAYESVTLATDAAGRSYVHLEATRQDLESHVAYDPATYWELRDHQRLVLP